MFNKKARIDSYTQNALVHICDSRCNAHDNDVAAVDERVDGRQAKRERAALMQLRANHNVTRCVSGATARAPECVKSEAETCTPDDPGREWLHDRCRPTLHRACCIAQLSAQLAQTATHLAHTLPRNQSTRVESCVRTKHASHRRFYHNQWGHAAGYRMMSAACWPNMRRLNLQLLCPPERRCKRYGWAHLRQQRRHSARDAGRAACPVRFQHQCCCTCKNMTASRAPAAAAQQRGHTQRRCTPSTRRNFQQATSKQRRARRGQAGKCRCWRQTTAR
jgi:hypothetical protein